MGKPRIDLTGQRFGKLLVLGFAEEQRGYASRFLCLCDCGNKKVVMGQNIKSGSTASCGCRQIERGRELGRGQRKYSESQKSCLRSWKAMNSRCRNEKNVEYRNYGGRGIKICKRWNSFWKFYEDMGDRPKGTSLDRINNNGNYEPNNCRWATPLEQSRNTRKIRFVEWEGSKVPLGELCERLGLRKGTVGKRLDKGYSLEEAVRPEDYGTWEKSTSRDRLFIYKGITKRLTYWIQEWSKKYEIKEVTLWSRINKGWSIEKVLNTPVDQVKSRASRSKRWA